MNPLSRNVGAWVMRLILTQVQGDSHFTKIDPNLQTVINKCLTDIPLTDISPQDKEEAMAYLKQHGLRSVAA
jgi:hypothetical protein